MNTNYSNHKTIFSSADYCFQSYAVPNNNQHQQSSFPIIQEIPNKKQKIVCNDHANTAYPLKRQQQMTASKSSELKFKIESVGIHPEDDDDLDMCPARVRPCWPKKIIPWWIASHQDEKPPYSYATLIAHAILASKDGRLTLNDIYTWIADNYPAFSIGNGGWQNSIRHNLSLNKKWFCKIDRRPTQANPGKGCYWTLIAGTEQIFIDNLTQEGGHSRKHHDIGLTTELSIRHRRGACYYNNNAPGNIVTPGYNQQISLADNDSASALITPPPTPTKPDVSNKPLLSPLYTTFKMFVMADKSQQSQTEMNNELLDDSDNDSGIDVSNQFVDTKHFRKRRRTNNSNGKSNSSIPASAAIISSPPSKQPLQHVNTSMVYDTPTSTPISSFDLAPTTNLEINNWVEHSLLYSDNQLDEQIQWPASAFCAPPMLGQSNSWCTDDSIVVPTSSPSVNNVTFVNNNNRKRRHPITINLDDEEITHKYLHFEEDEEDLLRFDTSIIPFNNNTSSMLINNVNNFTNNTYYNLYPQYIPSPITTTSSKCANTTTTTYPSSTSIATSSSLLHNFQLQQFVTMQDILYS